MTTVAPNLAANLAPNETRLAAGVDPRYVEQARKLAPLIEAEAAAGEEGGTLTAPVVEALRESGLFNLMIPAELGGSEVNAVTAISVFEELTAADASSGWSHMANVSSSAFVAYLRDEAVSVMFGDGPVIIAGQYAPKGPAVAVDGGYQVSGSYSFGSGSGHANWMGGGTIEMENGAPRFIDGRPFIRAFFVPRSEVEFLGNWDVMGLAGTGSYDYAVSERVVPDEFTFLITTPTQYRGGSLYGLGVMGMTSAGHAGFALGVSRRAIDEVLSLAARKQRMGHPTPVAGIERFQYELGRHTAKLRAARAFVYDAFSSVQSALAPGEMLSATSLAVLRQATTHATHVSSEVVDFAYHWSGADGIRPGVMQRLWRDTHTSTQHIFVDDSTFTEAGKQLLIAAGSLPGLNTMTAPHNAYALRLILDEYSGLLAGVTPAQWAAPTPCENWDVRALVNHVVMGQYVFAAALQGQDRPDVTADYLADDPAGSFRRSSEILLTAFDLDAVMSKMITVPFGEIPGIGAMHLRAIEGLVHGWDLAQATGQSINLPEEIIGTELVFAQNAIGAVPREGRFADEQSVSSDAPALEQLAALLGRSV